MIVSHQHKLIFLKARKVAGTSFEIALSRYCGEDDIISPLSREDEAIRRKLGFAGPRNNDYSFARLLSSDRTKATRIFGRRIPTKFYNHMPAWLVRWYLGKAIFDSYTKVSIVRNPWDRAISMFFWKSSKHSADPDVNTFTDYFRKKKPLLAANHRIYMIGGKPVVDHFIRYEHFRDDTLALEVKIPALAGLWDTLEGIKAKGSTRNRTLTPGQIFAMHPEVDAMVAEVNAWDIATFGYTRPA